jgi:hypothetical protein
MKLPVKKTAFTLCYALIFAFIVCAPRAVLANTDNLLSDAGFEQQLSAGQGGWILFDESRFSSDQARGGRQSVFNWGFSRSLPSPPFLVGTASGSYQEFSARPGSRWRLTGYSFTPAALKGISAFGIVQVSFFDERGNDLGTVETANTKGPRAKTSNQLNSQSPVGEWIFLDTGVATAPANTAKMQAFTLFVDYSGSEISQGVYFDDLKLCSLDAGNGGSDCK